MAENKMAGYLKDDAGNIFEVKDIQARQNIASMQKTFGNYALKEEIPKNASDVGADPSGTATAEVSGHNTNTAAHNDIRLLITETKKALAAFLDTDEETMNELSELIAAINNNKTSVEALTTGKVNVTDIINNLTTNLSNRPLAAAQGVAIKNLINALQRSVDMIFDSYILNGEEKTLTVGVDIQVGQVIDFYYLVGNGYTVKYRTKCVLLPKVNVNGVDGSEAKYDKASMTVDDVESYTFTGVYADLPAGQDLSSYAKKEEVEQLSEEIANYSNLFHETIDEIFPFTNMVDKYGYLSRSKLNRDGSVLTGTTYNVWVTEFIPVKKGQKIRIKFNDRTSINTTSMYHGLYDEEKTIPTTYNLTYNFDTIAANAQYGEMTINGNYIEWDTSTITFGGWTGFAYARFMLESLDVVITVDEEITDESTPIYEAKPTLRIPKQSIGFDVAEKPLVGKKVVCFGDSLFGRTTDETSALYQTANITGADLYNVGFGGSTMSRVGSNAYSQFSFPALVDAVTSDTWTNQDANVSTVEKWSEQLEKLKGIDFNIVDIVVVHYGTNDFTGGDRAIDNTSNPTDITSICGALRYGINKLLTAYPKLKFYISVPVFRYWGSAGSYTYPETYKNAKNNTLLEVIEGLRNVALEYNFPVIDGYYGMGVNKLNAEYYLADQTHHNMAGMKLFGEFIAAQLTGQQSFGTGTGRASDGYSKSEIDAMFGSYVDDIAVLVGGDA